MAAVSDLALIIRAAADESLAHDGNETPANEGESRAMSECAPGGQPLLTGVSDNVGAVKHFLSVLTHALRRARHFALS